MNTIEEEAIKSKPQSMTEDDGSTSADATTKLPPVKSSVPRSWATDSASTKCPNEPFVRPYDNTDDLQAGRKSVCEVWNINSTKD